MGHGYFAVLANGILIDLKSIQNHIKTNKKNTIMLISELEYANETYSDIPICERYIGIDKLKICFSKYRFQFHYEDQYTPTNVFITLVKKQIWMDTRGDSGCPSIVDTEKLQLTEDEMEEIHNLAILLTGKNQLVEFMMYTYEGS